MILGMTPSRTIVIGGSVAGLMAAAAVSARFDEVSIIERDDLPQSPEPRTGVPQSTQVHVILPLGLDRMEQLLPGIRQAFIERGCLEFDQLAQVPTLGETAWKVRVHSANAVAFRRPLFELVIREHVLALGNVSIRHGSVRGVTLTEDKSRVRGIALRDGSQLDADFVIDASGRRTRMPVWLQEAGFQNPTEVQANAYMGYTTQFVKLPDSALDGILGLIAHPEPGHLKGGILLPADNGVFSLSAVGMMRDYPPRDREGFLDFLDQARSPLLGEIARQSVPVSDVNPYRQDGNLWRRWDTADLPRRLLVVGDAAASFNPIYGQGMTLAASGGAALQAALQADTPLDELAHDVQGRLSTVIEAAFSMSAAVDSSFEGAQCLNYTPPGDAERAYSATIEHLTTVDPEVALAAGLSAFYVDPDVLKTDAIKIKVAGLQQVGEPAGTSDFGDYPQDIATVKACRAMEVTASTYV